MADSRGRPDFGDGLRAGGAQGVVRRVRPRGQLWPAAGGLPDRSGRHVHRHAGAGGQAARARCRADHAAARPRPARRDGRAASAGCREHAGRLHAFPDRVVAGGPAGPADGSGYWPALGDPRAVPARRLHSRDGGSGQRVARVGAVGRVPGPAARTHGAAWLGARCSRIHRARPRGCRLASRGEARCSRAAGRGAGAGGRLAAGTRSCRGAACPRRKQR